MKKLFLILITVFLPQTIVQPLFAAKPESVTIGFIPSEPSQRLKSAALKLAKHIQKKIGITTNIYISKDYQGLIDAMDSGKIDFAFFTAMSFVFAEKQAGAKVLLKKVWNKSPFYYSTILTRKNSNIESIKDLKGKTFAFVDKKSTSGFLYPNVYFKGEKIDPEKYFGKVIFAGNHQAAVQKVKKGLADGAAVFSDEKDGSKNAWTNYFPGDKGFRVLWVSDPIPNDPFCVRESFYKKNPMITHEVMFALLEMKDSDEGNLLKEILGIEELQYATSRQYEPVRKMVKTLKLELSE